MQNVYLSFTQSDITKVMHQFMLLMLGKFLLLYYVEGDLVFTVQTQK